MSFSHFPQKQCHTSITKGGHVTFYDMPALLFQKLFLRVIRRPSFTYDLDITRSHGIIESLCDLEGLAVLQNDVDVAS